MRYFFIIFCGLWTTNIIAQDTLQAPQDQLLLEIPNSIDPNDFGKIHQIEDTLGVLGYAIVNDSLAENRFASCRKFIPTLVDALKHKNSFDYTFERLNTISITYAPDSTFRIFTWQLYVDVDDYRYYGAIQMNTPDLQLFPLIDRSESIAIPEFEVTDNENWYGALYYNILPIDTPEGKKYTLFGYDGYRFFTKRKILDVLHFKDGKPVFGAPIFVASAESSNHPQQKMRVVREYYAGASVKLNYDEIHKVILFDHLEPMGMTKEGPKMVPDGTYEAYQVKDGNWVHIEKMFHEILDEAPREQPLFRDDATRETRRDILGKSRN